MMFGRHVVAGRAGRTGWSISSRRAGWLGLALMVVFARGGWAFDPPIDTAGPLTVRIEGPAEISQVERPVSLTKTRSPSRPTGGRSAPGSTVIAKPNPTAIGPIGSHRSCRRTCG